MKYLLLGAMMVGFLWFMFSLNIWVGLAALVTLVLLIVGAVVQWDKLRKSPGTTGIGYEHYVAERLRQRGYRDVRVTQASGDYGADILAVNPLGQSVCVQCKRYSGSVGVAAVQQIATARLYYKCDKAAVVTTSSFTKAAKELAAQAEVELIENFT